MQRMLRPVFDAAQIRSCLVSGDDIVSTPPLDGDVEAMRGWLREVWERSDVAAAVEVASPVLAEQVEAISAGRAMRRRQVARVCESVSRYELRMRTRATPFGLFSGVAPLVFGSGAEMVFGDRHCRRVGVDAAWLSSVVSRLERILLDGLKLHANDAAFRRGGHLVIPYQPTTGDKAGPIAEITVAITPAVNHVLSVCSDPRIGADVAASLGTTFGRGHRGAILAFLSTLVEKRVLLTDLVAPSTAADPLGHVFSVVDQATNADAAVEAILEPLRVVHTGINRHNVDDSSPERQRRQRAQLSTAMTRLVEPASRFGVLTCDTAVDASVTLPRDVGEEAATAAAVLLRLSAYPRGTRSWGRWRQAFIDAYGVGTLVQVGDAVDVDSGIGYPDGYYDSDTAPGLTARDTRLLRLAAAADGAEVVLDEQAIKELAVDEPAQLPSHVEICVRVDAASAAAVDVGDFRLTVVSASRAATTMTGRFLRLFGDNARDHARAAFVDLPTMTSGAVHAGLSFAPLYSRAGNVTRAVEIFAQTVYLGGDGGSGAMRWHDLAIIADWERLFLVHRPSGQFVEPVITNALNLATQVPPLARFLSELPRAHASVFTGFDWGIAAVHLPVLPRLRYGRTVISPTTWRVPSLAGALDLQGWRERYRVPARVHLNTRGTAPQLLDLDTPAGVAAVEAARSDGSSALTEAPDLDAAGWCDGRATEVVIPLAATATISGPVFDPGTAPTTGRDHGYLPGVGSWCAAHMYISPDHADEIIANHLPLIMKRHEGTWWTQYRDSGGFHLRIRIPTGDHGQVISNVGTWAAGLRSVGLASDLTIATYRPETGRYGTGSTLAAAERLFSADSLAVVVAHRQINVSRSAVVAAGLINLAAAFTGDLATGLSWLESRPDPAGRKQRLDRSAVAEAAALITTPPERLRQAWRSRADSARTYRACIDASNLDADTVLESLLHMHHNRAAGIDRDVERHHRRTAHASAQTLIHRPLRQGAR